jgi:nucleoside-diphosphate-sugar epimerase
MKVLVTGATGFVGGHILERLLTAGLPVVAMVRTAEQAQALRSHHPRVETRLGTLDSADELVRIMEGISHVVHAAGATKAIGSAGFYRVNQIGTRHLLEAVNQSVGQVQRLIHISSLAAAGPASAAHPAREHDEPKPVSHYGRSKLVGEVEVRAACRCEFVILRPPGVYGPRDVEFLKLFKAIRGHVCPLFGGGRQELSLVHVSDLAAVVASALTHPAAAGQTYHVAAAETVTTGALAREVARLVGTWTIPLRLPTPAFWPVCLAADLVSRCTGRASVLSLQKYAELRAPGWVCACDKLERELGLICPTQLADGLAQTLRWYREAGWLARS